MIWNRPSFVRRTLNPIEDPIKIRNLAKWNFFIEWIYSKYTNVMNHWKRNKILYFKIKYHFISEIGPNRFIWYYGIISIFKLKILYSNVYFEPLQYENKIIPKYKLKTSKVKIILQSVCDFKVNIFHDGVPWGETLNENKT